MLSSANGMLDLGNSEAGLYNCSAFSAISCPMGLEKNPIKFPRLFALQCFSETSCQISLMRFLEKYTNSCIGAHILFGYLLLDSAAGGLPGSTSCKQLKDESIPLRAFFKSTTSEFTDFFHKLFCVSA